MVLVSDDNYVLGLLPDSVLRNNRRRDMSSVTYADLAGAPCPTCRGNQTVASIEGDALDCNCTLTSYPGYDPQWDGLRRKCYMCSGKGRYFRWGSSYSCGICGGDSKRLEDSTGKGRGWLPVDEKTATLVLLSIVHGREWGVHFSPPIEGLYGVHLNDYAPVPRTIAVGEGTTPADALADALKEEAEHEDT